MTYLYILSPLSIIFQKKGSSASTVFPSCRKRGEDVDANDARLEPADEPLNEDVRQAPLDFRSEIPQHEGHARSAT